MQAIGRVLMITGGLWLASHIGKIAAIVLVILPIVIIIEVIPRS